MRAAARCSHSFRSRELPHSYPARRRSGRCRFDRRRRSPASRWAWGRRHSTSGPAGPGRGTCSPRIRNGPRRAARSRSHRRTASKWGWAEPGWSRWRCSLASTQASPLDTRYRLSTWVPTALRYNRRSVPRNDSCTGPQSRREAWMRAAWQWAEPGSAWPWAAAESAP